MKYPKGIGVVVIFIAVGTLIAVAGVGIIIQKNNINRRVQEKAVEVDLLTEPTRSVISTPSTDASDATLDKDFSDIDTSMNVINDDATSIDTGLNDQMGDLSE